MIFLISTIILFELGQGFREGYFSGFSVDISQVPVSFHETLYWGYLANFIQEVFILFLILVSFIVARRQFIKKRPTKPFSRRLTLSLPELGLMLIIGVLVFGYLLAGIATNSGRELSGVMMKAFLTNEMKAAETYKLRCVHMKWAKDESGESRAMYAYQLFCNDKLCKVFEPVTKTFPTVFLDGIRSITPYPSPVGKRESCIAVGSAGSK